MHARFLADSTLTLAAVARAFSVSPRLVRERAATERWREERLEVDRQNGDKLWTAAKRKIVDLAGGNALAYLADLRRLNEAIAARYLGQLEQPEFEEEQTGDIVVGEGEDSPFVGTKKKVRRSAVNLPRFAAKMFELERQALKDFLGIEAGGSGKSVTFEETHTRAVKIG